MIEVWKAIPGYGGHYEASSMGRIRVKDRVVEKRSNFAGGKVVKQFYKGRMLSPCASDRLGHMSVHIGLEGKKHTASVHSLVLAAFVGPRPEGAEACHNNGIASDNRPSNLRWDTHHNNNQDRLRHGTYARGEAHPMARLTPDVVLAIRASGLGCKDAAASFGLSVSQAHRILHRKSWAHLA